MENVYSDTIFGPGYLSEEKAGGLATSQKGRLGAGGWVAWECVRRVLGKEAEEVDKEMESEDSGAVGGET